MPITKIAHPGFPLRWLPVALFLMPLVIHIICLPVAGILNNGSLPWQSWLVPDNEGFYHTPDQYGWGIINGGELFIKILINAFTGLIIVSLFAFLEEVGWRAWMLPKLVDLFDIKKGVLYYIILICDCL